MVPPEIPLVPLLSKFSTTALVPSTTSSHRGDRHHPYHQQDDGNGDDDEATHNYDGHAILRKARGRRGLQGVLWGGTELLALLIWVCCSHTPKEAHSPPTKMEYGSTWKSEAAKALSGPTARTRASRTSRLLGAGSWNTASPWHSREPGLWRRLG